MDFAVVLIAYILIAAITISLISWMVEEFDIVDLEDENFAGSCILQVMLGLAWPITIIGLGIAALTLLVFEHLE